MSYSRSELREVLREELNRKCKRSAEERGFRIFLRCLVIYISGAFLMFGYSANSWQQASKHKEKLVLSSVFWPIYLSSKLSYELFNKENWKRK